MASISSFTFLLLVFGCCYCLTFPGDRWRVGGNQAANDQAIKPFELSLMELLQIKLMVVEELKLNTFRITQQSGTFSLHLQELETGSTLAIDMNVQTPMDLTWIILNSSQSSDTLHANRLAGITQYTLFLKKESENTEMMLILKGKSVKSFAVFELRKEIHYQTNLVTIWLCGMFLFLVAIGLASNMECWETNPIGEVTFQKYQVTQKYRILQLMNSVAGCDCSICMGCFTKGQLLSITNCYHVFHMECFEPWYTSHTKCPYCRQSLVSYAWDSQTPKQIHEFEQTLSQRNHTQFILREPTAAEPEEQPLVQNTTE